MKNAANLLLIVFVWMTAVATADPVRVVATIEPLADWVRMVGGNQVCVETLLAPGHSPHTYDPTPGDMRKTADAAIFVKVGLHLDDWADKLAQAVDVKEASPLTTRTKQLALGDWLKENGKLPNLSSIEPPDGVVSLLGHAEMHEDDHDHDHDANGVDPHFWLDPSLGQICVGVIAEQLTAVAPERAVLWKAGAARATEELRILDEQISSTLAKCKRHKIACFHDGYKYLAARYGLIRVAVIEEYAGKAPGERYLIQLVRDIKRTKITAIFAEPQLNRRIADVIAAEAGVRVLILDPLGGTPGRETYIKNMLRNAAELEVALKE